MRRSAVFLIIALAFIGFLLYTTLAPQRIECEVCVVFNDGSRCAKASGDSKRAASETAQTAACGPLARGMDQTIACGRAEPTKVTCSGS
jgi:hypothetical protein